jgi:putative tryptophan/tyrosine transport system substrate-binding protein
MTRMQVASGKWRSGLAAMFVVALSFGLLAAAWHVEAQQGGRTFHVAFVHFPTQLTSTSAAGLEAMRQVLRDRGWIDGKDYVIELRLAESEEKLPEMAAQVVREKFDLIVTTNTFAAIAVKAATTTIPMVMAGTCDPVDCGVVGGNLAHPGGNITGSTVITSEVAGKRIEFLKEMVPGLRRVAALPWGPETFCVRVVWLTQSEAAARALGITLQRAEVDPWMSADQWDATFGALKKDGVGAVTVMEGVPYGVQAPQIAAAALKHRLPTVFPFRSQVEAGGLMSFGANSNTMWQRAAHSVDRIFRGAKPGDLPIEQPTKFDLLINGKTAKALDLTIPPPLLMRGAEVIE